MKDNGLLMCINCPDEYGVHPYYLALSSGIHFIGNICKGCFKEAAEMGGVEIKQTGLTEEVIDRRIPA